MITRSKVARGMKPTPEQVAEFYSDVRVDKFDIDGTLDQWLTFKASVTEFWTAAVTAVVNDRRCTTEWVPDAEQKRGLFDLATAGDWTKICGMIADRCGTRFGVSVTPAEVTAFVKANVAKFLRSHPPVRQPHIVAVLEARQRQGSLLSTVTSSYHEAAEVKLRMLDLVQFFPVRVADDGQVNPLKPSYHPWAVSATRHGYEFDQMVTVVHEDQRHNFKGPGEKSNLVKFIYYRREETLELAWAALEADANVKPLLDDGRILIPDTLDDVREGLLLLG